MDFEQFESLRQLRPFEITDVKRLDAQFRRRTALALALWGKTAEDLQRQLLAPHPEVPAGTSLDDLRDLQQSSLTTAWFLSKPSHRWLSSNTLSSWTIFVGSRRLTAWEARFEVVHRAIEYFESR